LVPHRSDAWTLALDEMRGFLGRAQASGARESGSAPASGLFDEGDETESFRELAGSFITRVRQLGLRTGQVHLALAADAHDSAFAPEPFTNTDQHALAASVRELTGNLFAILRKRDAGSSADDPAAPLLGREPEIESLAARIADREVTTAKIRTHGDYHLGQVLDTGNDFVIIDFEGEPQRSLAERKQKRSPLRDVAGMLRSFHYAAHSALNELGAERAQLGPLAERWSQLMGRTFFRSWIETCAGAPFLPASIDDVRILLDAFLLEKAIYEVLYELNNRPTWVAIPVRGIQQILDAAR
jgi:maltose alpha-D-glucosyltransferase/alpha-amylase